MRISRTAEWAWIVFAFLLLNLAYANSQPVNNVHEGFGSGQVYGQVYYAVAKNTPRELPPHGEAPFVYRIGTPFLAAGLAKSLDWPISAGFDRLDIAVNALSVFLLTLLLKRHVANAFARLLVIVAFM